MFRPSEKLAAWFIVPRGETREGYARVPVGRNSAGRALLLAPGAAVANGLWPLHCSGRGAVAIRTEARGVMVPVKREKNF